MCLCLCLSLLNGLTNGLGTHTATNRPNLPAERESMITDEIHFSPEVAEDNGGLIRLLKNLCKGLKLGSRAGPIRSMICALELRAHTLDIELRMNEKLLDPHIELKNKKSRNMTSIHESVKIVGESTEQFALFGTLRNGETMTDKGGFRRNGVRQKRISTDILHSAAQHDDRSEIRHLCRTCLGLEPSTEIDPVLSAILNGSSTENPAAWRLSGNGHTGPKPLSRLTVADNMSLIKNDTIELGGPEVDSMEMCDIVGGDDRSSPMKVSKTRNRQITRLKFLCPTGK